MVVYTIIPIGRGMQHLIIERSGALQSETNKIGGQLKLQLHPFIGD